MGVDNQDGAVEGSPGDESRSEHFRARVRHPPAPPIRQKQLNEENRHVGANDFNLWMSLTTPPDKNQPTRQEWERLTAELRQKDDVIAELEATICCNCASGSGK